MKGIIVFTENKNLQNASIDDLRIQLPQEIRVNDDVLLILISDLDPNPDIVEFITGLNEVYLVFHNHGKTPVKSIINECGNKYKDHLFVSNIQGNGEFPDVQLRKVLASVDPEAFDNEDCPVAKGIEESFILEPFHGDLKSNLDLLHKLLAGDFESIGEKEEKMMRSFNYKAYKEKYQVNPDWDSLRDLRNRLLANI
jgi:hypothetical protein